MAKTSKPAKKSSSQDRTVNLDRAVLVQVEDKIRELINWIEVLKMEEDPSTGQRIEDEAAAELEDKIKDIASLLGIESL